MSVPWWFFAGPNIQRPHRYATDLSVLPACFAFRGGSLRAVRGGDGPFSVSIGPDRAALARFSQD